MGTGPPILPRGGRPPPVSQSRGNRPSTRRVFTLLACLTVTCGCVALLALDPGLLSSSSAAGGGEQRFITAPSGGPTPLAFPLWWHAPIFSESGERLSLLLRV